MRFTTDIEGLDDAVPAGVTVSNRSAQRVPSRLKRLALLTRDALRSDYLILHFDFVEVLFFAIVLSLWPFRRCRIVTLDLFVPVLRPALRPLVGFALRRVWRLLVYFRDSRVFEQRFGIAPGKFRYVPFKINAFPSIQAAVPSDGGYVFSGGRSRRDFAALFAALGELGYPAKVVIGSVKDLAQHGSALDGLKPPPNVELLTDDRIEFFIDCMAASRIVALPLLRDAVTQAGIGVCIMAMALRKCVIVSEGLGIHDVLRDGQAVIVPAGDVAALREAMRRAWDDEELRDAVARRGYDYALSLGDAGRLRQSIVEAIAAP